MQLLRINLPAALSKSTAVLGLEVNVMAIVVLAATLAIVAAVAVSYLRARKGESGAQRIRPGTALLATLMLIVLPAALFAYTVDCVVRGGCTAWALVLTAAFAAYAIAVLVRRGAIASALATAVSRQRKIGKAIKRGVAAVKAGAKRRTRV